MPEKVTKEVFALYAKGPQTPTSTNSRAGTFPDHRQRLEGRRRRRPAVAQRQGFLKTRHQRVAHDEGNIHGVEENGGAR